MHWEGPDAVFSEMQDWKKPKLSNALHNNLPVDALLTCESRAGKWDAFTLGGPKETMTITWTMQPCVRSRTKTDRCWGGGRWWYLKETYTLFNSILSMLIFCFSSSTIFVSNGSIWGHWVKGMYTILQLFSLKSGTFSTFQKMLEIQNSRIILSLDRSFLSRNKFVPRGSVGNIWRQFW